MIQISRQEVDRLRDCGLSDFIKVANRSHGARAKSYYAIEHPKVLNALNGKENNGRKSKGYRNKAR